MKYQERIENQVAKLKLEEDQKIATKNFNNQFMAYRLNQIICRHDLNEKLQRNEEILDKIKKV
jgi:hypothetical protein